jgi:predicted HicB family RNase H-like nuclease
MQIEGHVEALREDLARVAAVGDESTARAAELLAVALEAAFARRLQDALAEAALELSGRLEEGSVEVRVAGAETELVYVADTRAAATADAGDALDARITLRLSDALKSRVDAAAAASGVSVNTWLVQSLTRLLAPRPIGGTGRNRLTGYGRS